MKHHNESKIKKLKNRNEPPHLNKNQEAMKGVEWTHGRNKKIVKNNLEHAQGRKNANADLKGRKIINK